MDDRLDDFLLEEKIRRQRENEQQQQPPTGRDVPLATTKEGKNESPPIPMATSLWWRREGEESDVVFLLQMQPQTTNLPRTQISHRHVQGMCIRTQSVYVSYVGLRKVIDTYGKTYCALTR